MENKVPAYLLRAGDDQNEPVIIKRAKLSFVNKTLMNAASTVKSIYLQAENSTKENFMSRINPHVKVISLIYFEIMISMANNLAAQLLAMIFIFFLFITARLNIFRVYRKILLIGFIFGFLIILPASLNVITPGKIIFSLIKFDEPSHFWIYNIPQDIGFTSEGVFVVSLLFLRVLNSVSFAMLVVFTTSFPAFIKSFKIIGVPDTFLMIISLAYKFIFILSRTIEETYFALKSRLICKMKNSNMRKLVSGMIFFIFKKSMTNYENTYYAMVSRGYRGKVILHAPQRFSSGDFIALIIIVVSGIGIILI
jgi:cobalt/nickel transport system permease protein